MYYVNMRYIKSLWDSKARLIAVLAGVLCHVPRLHSLSQAAQSGSSQCFRLDFADSLASMLLCRTPRNQDSSTLQDSFRILQHSAVVLELVQATGKATLPRSRRPSFSFMKSQGCKIQELQTGTCLRSQVLLWQWRFMLVSRLSDLHMEVLACLVFFATVLSLSLVNVLLHLLPGYKFVTHKLSYISNMED